MSKKMPKWAKVLLVAVIVIAGVRVAWGIVYPSGTWRYKLTVEVETPEGVRVGSAVREVGGRYSPELFGQYSLHVGLVRGEAVVVDLGERGVLFALNRTYKRGWSGGHTIVYDAFPNAQARDADMISYYSSLKAGPIELPAESYPVLVRFRDPQDPGSVEDLLEMHPCPDMHGRHSPLCIKYDRFAEAFGEGVKLKSIMIEMKSAPVIMGVVEKYLPPPDGKPHLYTRDDFIRE